MKKLFLILALLALPVQALDFGLIWDKVDPLEEVQGYKLYEKTIVAQTPVYTLVGTTTAAVNTIDLKGVSNVKHVYVVTAFNVIGESPYSNECIVAPAPGGPRNLRIKIQ